MRFLPSLAGFLVLLAACGDDSGVGGSGGGGDGDGGESAGGGPTTSSGCSALTESCDGDDDDCDGEIDEGCACVVGAIEPCYDGPPAARGIGACVDGSRSCASADDGATSAWSACQGWVAPEDEVCNGVDDDCDGVEDDLSAPDSVPVIDVISAGSPLYSGPAIRIDATDVLHLTFFQNKTPHYVNNALGSWGGQPIGQASHGPYDTSLVLDADGFVHAAFTYNSYPSPDVEDLHYATNLSGAFVESTIDGAGDTGYFISIDVDPSGFLHAAYFRASGSDFMYANNESGAWVTEIVDQSGTPQYQSMVVDAAGDVHVGYGSYGGDARYARRSGGVWALESIDPGPNTGKGAAIALDGAGHVHMSYIDDAQGVLRHATNASGAWQLETVGPAGGSIFDTAIQVAANGDVFIGFDGPLDQPSLAAYVGGEWIVGDVESGVVGGIGGAMALDSTGAIHLVYRVGTVGVFELHHAVIAAPDGVDSDCNGVAW